MRVIWKDQSLEGQRGNTTKYLLIGSPNKPEVNYCSRESTNRFLVTTKTKRQTLGTRFKRGEKQQAAEAEGFVKRSLRTQKSLQCLQRRAKRYELSGPPSWATASTKRSWRSAVHRRRGLGSAVRTRLGPRASSGGIEASDPWIKPENILLSSGKSKPGKIKPSRKQRGRRRRRRRVLIGSLVLVITPSSPVSQCELGFVPINALDQ